MKTLKATFSNGITVTADAGYPDDFGRAIGAIVQAFQLGCIVETMLTADSTQVQSPVGVMPTPVVSQPKTATKKAEAKTIQDLPAKGTRVSFVLDELPAYRQKALGRKDEMIGTVADYRDGVGISTKVGVKYEGSPDLDWFRATELKVIG